MFIELGYDEEKRAPQRLADAAPELGIASPSPSTRGKASYVLWLYTDTSEI